MIDIFSTLFFQILPLYSIVLVTWLAGRFIDIDPQAIARLVIYAIAPVIFFNAAYSIDLNLETLSLPFIYTGLLFFMLIIGKQIAPFLITGKKEINLFSVTIGSKNSGYMGIPIAVLLFPPELTNIYILMIAGGIFNEVLINYYVLARSHFSIEESIRKILSMPLLYAVLLGFIANSFNVDLPEFAKESIDLLKGSYVVLGMGILGLSVAKIKNLKIDFKSVTGVLVMHILIWPALIFILIIVDQSFLHFLSEDIYPALLLVSIMPVAANVVAYATELNVNPEEATSFVLISTLISLTVIPVFIGLFIV